MDKNLEINDFSIYPFAGLSGSLSTMPHVWSLMIRRPRIDRRHEWMGGKKVLDNQGHPWKTVLQASNLAW